MKAKVFPLPFRAISAVLAALLTFETVPGYYAFAASPSGMPQASPSAVRSRQDPTAEQTPNRQPKRGAPAVPVDLSPRFSDQPTRDEFFRAHVFSHPLVPVGISAPDEDKALADALVRYVKRSRGDDHSIITRFLEQHPKSAWKPVLLLNLGIAYRQQGFFSRAIAAWEEAWQMTKAEPGMAARAMADEIAGELLLLRCWTGSTELVEKFLADIAGRQFVGGVGETVSMARQARWLEDHKSDEIYKCGPEAIRQVLGNQGANADARKLFLARSTPRGFSLARLKQLADESGLQYRMARRKPGAAIPRNSIVHWKTGHYGVVAEEQQDGYVVQDTGFTHFYGSDLWVNKTAMDEETDGYFLIPADSGKDWPAVEPAEAQNVYGRGPTPYPDQRAFTPWDHKTKNCPPCCGMPVYSAHLMLVSLNIVDTPIGYTPPRGPEMMFTVTYNQRNPYTSYYADYSNLGVCWSFDWFSYVSDNGKEGSRTAVTRYVLGGGAVTHSDYDSGTGKYAPDRFSGVLQYIVPDAQYPDGAYVLNMPDGSRQIFSQPSTTNPSGPRKMFLTSLEDSSGNAVTLSYDAPGRIKYIDDALNQRTTLHYTGAGFRIESIEDPFGRFARFEYDEYGRLKKITDMIGMSSSFTYDRDKFTFIKQMGTPYGVSRFTSTDTSEFPYSRELIMEDAEGNREKVWYNQLQVLPEEPIPDQVDPVLYWHTAALTYRNTYYFDKHATHSFDENNITNATIYHWLHETTTMTSGTLESVKRPLESRTWFLYPGQTWSAGAAGITIRKPSVLARVVEDPENPNNHVTQTNRFEYNEQGNVTQIVDALFRTNTFEYYSNGLDLKKVRRTTAEGEEVEAEFGEYDSQHCPSVYTNAARQAYTFAWNNYGQLIGITNPLSQVTLMNRAGDGYLLNVQQLWSGGARTTAYTYDNFGRTETVTSPDNYTITYQYDNLDRLAHVIYPDQTFEQYEYDRLDLIAARDRANRRTVATYDRVGRMTSLTDRLRQTTWFSWCGCGGLDSMTDALNQVTSWEYDLQGRVTKKFYADSETPGLQYAYHPQSGRLKSVTDAKNQAKQYTYNLDDTLRQIAYVGEVIATPDVSLTYDPYRRRLATMTDGTGTTMFGYHPVTAGGTLGALELASVDGPLDNDIITFSYDELGRMTNQAINTNSESVAYDGLGRVTNHVTALGAFVLAYVSDSGRLSSITAPSPNSQVTLFDYFDNSGDQRLKQIWNKNKNGATNSKFDYQYDAMGRISQWTQQLGVATPDVKVMEYDLEDQLLGMVIGPQGQSPTKAYGYGYSPAGNRLREQVETPGSGEIAVTVSEYNNVNQLTARSGTGPFPVRFGGRVNEPATVKVNGVAAEMKQDPQSAENGKLFGITLELPAGSNTVTIEATDFAEPGPNVTTEQYAVNVVGGEDRAYSYDLNGNCTNYTSASGNVSYEWDAEDRLVSFSKGNIRSEFTYDGFGRRVMIVEKTDGVVGSVKRFVWSGTRLCQERDATGANVTKQFYDEGQVIGAVNYFYTRDHLGSIREVTGRLGVVRARYDYDPYGRRVKLEGDVESDFGFTGHYYHAPSGLHLALYRAYDAETGRWLSRDPIGEEGGFNLYAYVINDPIDHVDPLGLQLIETDFETCCQNCKHARNQMHGMRDSWRAHARMHLVGVGGSVVSGLVACKVWPPAAVGVVGFGAFEIFEVYYTLKEGMENIQMARLDYKLCIFRCKDKYHKKFDDIRDLLNE